jgi:hypothetical protein
VRAICDWHGGGRFLSVRAVPLRVLVQARGDALKDCFLLLRTPSQQCAVGVLAYAIPHMVSSLSRALMTCTDVSHWINWVASLHTTKSHLDKNTAGRGIQHFLPGRILDVNSRLDDLVLTSSAGPQATDEHCTASSCGRLVLSRIDVRTSLMLRFDSLRLADCSKAPVLPALPGPHLQSL